MQASTYKSDYVGRDFIVFLAILFAIASCAVAISVADTQHQRVANQHRHMSV